MTTKNALKFGAIASVALSALTAAAAANFPVGTHLYKGTLLDWQNKVMKSKDSVMVQAVNTNGVVIATATVADPTAEGANFVLQIPLSTTATDKTAAVGDTLNCFLVSEYGISVPSDSIPVGEANTVTTISLQLVNTRAYTSGSTTVNVAQEYVEAIAPWMEGYDIPGEYDPFADYDNDGSSNYAEYCAGTNPFDPSDKLAITDYAAPQNALHTLSFEYVGGHVYGVSTTPTLTNPTWTTQSVRATETGAEQTQVLPSADEEDVGVTTIYMSPAEGATQQFFRLEAK